MNETSEADFIIEGQEDDREYPVAQLTGWEAIVFDLEDDGTQPW
jgi:hypothetical protein